MWKGKGRKIACMSKKKGIEKTMKNIIEENVLRKLRTEGYHHALANANEKELRLTASWPKCEIKPYRVQGRWFTYK